MPPPPREELKQVLKDFFYNEMIASQTLDSSQKPKIEAMTEERVEGLLQRFEKDLVIRDVKQIIVEDVRAELGKATRLDRIIDLSLIILPIIMSLLILAVTGTLGANLPILTIRGVTLDTFMFTGAALVLSVLQVVLFAVWKFRR